MSGQVLVMLASTDQLDARATVLVTFAAAAVGSFLAVAAQAWITRRGSQAHFRALLGALQEEVRSIADSATERSHRAPTDLRLDPPYPTSAWDTLVSSPEVRRLTGAYSSISHLYASVFAANYRTTQVATLLQISATAVDDDVRLAYRQLAQEFSSAQHRDVLPALAPAQDAIARSLS